jgi:putative membrane protein insertion efficiency factor
MLNRSLLQFSGYAAADYEGPWLKRIVVGAGWLSTEVLIVLIQIYRNLISPLLGPHCRFHPTCSTYAMEAIRKHGPFMGAARALARLGRCHPLNAGGYDPVR